MTRYHNKSSGKIAYTLKEDAERDAEESLEASKESERQKLRELIDINQTIKDQNIKLAKMVRAIFEVGNGNEIWSASDFSQEIKDFYQIMVEKLDRYDELGE